MNTSGSSSNTPFLPPSEILDIFEKKLQQNLRRDAIYAALLQDPVRKALRTWVEAYHKTIGCSESLCDAQDALDRFASMDNITPGSAIARILVRTHTAAMLTINSYRAIILSDENFFEHMHRLLIQLTAREITADDRNLIEVFDFVLHKQDTFEKILPLLRELPTATLLQIFTLKFARNMDFLDRAISLPWSSDPSMFRQILPLMEKFMPSQIENLMVTQASKDSGLRWVQQREVKAMYEWYEGLPEDKGHLLIGVRQYLLSTTLKTDYSTQISRSEHIRFIKKALASKKMTSERAYTLCSEIFKTTGVTVAYIMSLSTLSLFHKIKLMSEQKPVPDQVKEAMQAVSLCLTKMTPPQSLELAYQLLNSDLDNICFPLVLSVLDPQKVLEVLKDSLQEPKIWKQVLPRYQTFSPENCKQFAALLDPDNIIGALTNGVGIGAESNNQKVPLFNDPCVAECWLPFLATNCENRIQSLFKKDSDGKTPWDYPLVLLVCLPYLLQNGFKFGQPHRWLPKAYTKEEFVASLSTEFLTGAEVGKKIYVKSFQQLNQRYNLGLIIPLLTHTNKDGLPFFLRGGTDFRARFPLFLPLLEGLSLEEIDTCAGCFLNVGEDVFAPLLYMGGGHYAYSTPRMAQRGKRGTSLSLLPFYEFPVPQDKKLQTRMA